MSSIERTTKSQVKKELSAKARTDRATVAGASRTKAKKASVNVSRGMAVPFDSFVRHFCTKNVFLANGNVKVSKWAQDGTFTLGPNSCTIMRATFSPNFSAFKLRLMFKGEAAIAAAAFNERIEHIASESFHLSAVNGFDSYVVDGEVKYVMDVVIKLDRNDKMTGKLVLHVGTNKSELKMDKLALLGEKDGVSWDALWDQFNLRVNPFFYLMQQKGIPTLGVAYRLVEGSIVVPPALVDDVSAHMRIKSTNTKRAPKTKTISAPIPTEGDDEPTDQDIEDLMDDQTSD